MRDSNCQKCPLHKTTSHVCLLPQSIKQNEVVIIGDSPGDKEERTGIPFVGQAGKVLKEYLDKVGMDFEEVYMTYSVACKTPENRAPKTSELKACRHWLQQQLGKVKPKYVLLLGNTALEAVLDKKGIKSLRGKPLEIDGITYLPAYSPSFIMRDPSQEGIFEADLRLFKEIVEGGGIPKEEGLDVVVVDTPQKHQACLKALKDDISCDLETSSLYPWDSDAKVNSIGFGTEGKQWIYLINHPGTGITYKDIEKKLGKSVQEIVEDLDERVVNCYLVGQNFKFDALWMRVHYGVEWYADFDTMLAHFMLDENAPHGLKYLSQIYFGALDYDEDLKTKLGKGELTPFITYHAKDLYYTLRLKDKLMAQLRKEGDVKRVFDKIMMPCSKLFTKMEARGVYVNLAQMNEVEKKLRADLLAAETKLKAYGDINWASPKQLGELLYKKLKLPVIEKTPSGTPATSESVLKRLEHPMVSVILDHRAASKQLSAFIEGWKPFIDNGRIHPSFKLHGTVTGRLSCAHPNLQQVPRDPAIRSLLTAPEGWTLVEVDLSQIELRIAAEVAGERAMLQAFKDNIDVHWLTAIREIARGHGMADMVLATAATLLGKKVKYEEAIEALLKFGPDACQEVDKGWKELRKKAKAINFGYLYGMWWKKFKIYARDNYGVTDLTDQQAQQSREAYFDLYSDLPKWHDKQKRYARINGYVLTLSGRKRRLPAATLPNDCPERGAAERQAINSPVQSFANELNLMSLLQIDAEFDEDDVRPVGTVHDAILMEVRTEMVPQVVKRVLEIMSQPRLLRDFGIRLKVPVEADASIGPWGKGVSLEKWLEQKKTSLK